MKSRVLELGPGPEPASALLSMPISIPKVTHTIGLKEANFWEGVTHTPMNWETDPIPYPDHFFDFVISYHAIDYPSVKQLVYNEAYRVLKPTGMCLIIGGITGAFFRDSIGSDGVLTRLEEAGFTNISTDKKTIRVDQISQRYPPLIWDGRGFWLNWAFGREKSDHVIEYYAKAIK